MSLQNVEKAEVIKKYQLSPNDSGSARVQVALITARMSYLQEHSKSNPKDHHSKIGLLRLVSKRRRLLDYIRRNDVTAYRELIAQLGIRK